MRDVHESKSVHEDRIIKKKNIFYGKNVNEEKISEKSLNLLKNSHNKKNVHKGKTLNFFSKYFLKRVMESPQNINQPQDNVCTEKNLTRYTLPTKMTPPFKILETLNDLFKL